MMTVSIAAGNNSQLNRTCPLIKLPHALYSIKTPNRNPYKLIFNNENCWGDKSV